MTNLLEDITEEVIGAFVLGFIAIISIIVLTILGSSTGESGIINPIIKLILIIAFGIGLPIGIISIIKFLIGVSKSSPW